jgi:hypothetical protein
LTFSTSGDEGGVGQSLFDDHMHHGVEQRHVGVGLELDEAVGGARQFALARVHHDQLGAVLHRVFDPGGGHRVVDRRVGADDDDHVGQRHVHHRVAHGPRAYAFEQRRDTRCMTQAGAMVDVVAAEAQPHQLLE